MKVGSVILLLQVNSHDFEPTLLLNEDIPRALTGNKLRLKNSLLLPLIFEEINYFQSFKSEGRIQLEGNF